MKEEVIPPARLGSCFFTLLACAITFGVLVKGLGMTMTFLALFMCMFTVISLGLRTLPGATQVTLNALGMHLTDYYVPSTYRWSQIEKIELVKAEWKYGRPRVQDENLIIHLRPEGTAEAQKITLPALKASPRELLTKLTQYKEAFENKPSETIPPPLPLPAARGIYMVLIISGYVSSVLALVFCPPLFCGAGFAIGSLLVRKGYHHHGRLIKSMSLILGVLGFFFGMAVVACQETSAASEMKKRQWEEAAPLREALKKYREEQGR